MLRTIAAQSKRAGADFYPRGDAWNAATYEGKLHYRDALSTLSVPLPALAGDWQASNAALAIAMLRHQSRIIVPESAYRAGIGWARWPGRMQRLQPGPLADVAPKGCELWLDGCHNPAAAELVAAHLAKTPSDLPLHIICGILANKDAGGVLGPFAGLSPTLHAVPIPGHAHHAPAELAQWAATQGLTCGMASGVSEALGALSIPARVLIMGSLYLAGEVLRANDEWPD